MAVSMLTHFRLEKKIIFIIMFISNFYFAISVNKKHKLISIKQLPAKEGFITIFEEGIYIYDPDLMNIHKIYEFSESLNLQKEEAEDDFEKFKRQDIEYYTWLTKRFLLIYNTRSKNITSYDSNIENNFETFNMEINGAKLDLFSIKRDSEKTKIIVLSYNLNENLNQMKFIKEKELYIFNETFSKNKLECLMDKYNNLLKCFYYKNNLGIIELYLNEDNNKIIKEQIKKDVKINIEKNEEINKITSFASRNNNYLVCFLFKDNSSKCFVNNDKEFNLIQCSNQFKCKDIKVDYFEENDEFIFSCLKEKEIVLKIFKNLNSNSQIICSQKKFLIENNEDSSFLVIYNKNIKEYSILSSSHFYFPKKIRHLESNEDSTDNTNEFESNSIREEKYDESKTTNELTDSNINEIGTNTNSEEKLSDSIKITASTKEKFDSSESVGTSTDKMTQEEKIHTTEMGLDSYESSESIYQTTDFNKNGKDNLISNSNSITTDDIIPGSTTNTKESNSQEISYSSSTENGPILSNISSNLNTNENLESTSDYITKSTGNNYQEKSSEITDYSTILKENESQDNSENLSDSDISKTYSIEKLDKRSSSETMSDSSEEISTSNLNESSETLTESNSNSILKDEEDETQTNSISNTKENSEDISSSNLFKSSVITNDNELRYSSIMTEDSTENKNDNNKEENLQESSYLSTNLNKEEFDRDTDKTNDLSTNEIKYTSDKISDSFENLSTDNENEDGKKYESSIITDSMINTRENIKSIDSTYKNSIDSSTYVNKKTESDTLDASFYSSVITTENDSRYSSEIISDSSSKNYEGKKTYQESTDLTTNMEDYSSTILNSDSNINDNKIKESTDIENDSTINTQTDKNKEFSTNLGSTSDSFPVSSELSDDNLASTSIPNINDNNDNKYYKSTEISDFSTYKITQGKSLDFSTETLTNSNSDLNIYKSESNSNEISTNNEIKDSSEDINYTTDNYSTNSKSITYDNRIF